MSALICGSLAYDTLMVFKDHFKNHILPDKVHMLNVAFFVPEMRKDFGGVAGNISYNLKMLGGEPLPFASVGSDFTPYRSRFEALGISLKHVLQLDDCYTAQAYITTDLDNNQITAFHPGAMMRSNEQHVSAVLAADKSIKIGIVGPDSRDAMLQHANEFSAAGVPFIFDPGQALPLFNGEEFKHFIERAEYVCANDYESSLLSERTGWSPAQIAERVKAYIITRGGEGSTWVTKTGETTIPCATPVRVVEPTGCGDAYRAGLIYGLTNGMDLATTGRIASLAGTIKIEHAGPQNHVYSKDEFAQRFVAAFGYRF
jgi:adenosine kinase